MLTQREFFDRSTANETIPVFFFGNTNDLRCAVRIGSSSVTEITENKQAHKI